MSALLLEKTLLLENTSLIDETLQIGRVTVAPRHVATRPAAARTPSGPNAARPVVSARHLVGAGPAACQVAVDEPMWQLTRRGMVVVMGLLATVMGSVAVTCVVAFLSVSSSPL